MSSVQRDVAAIFALAKKTEELTRENAKTVSTLLGDRGESRRVDGTLARVNRGGNAITELGHSFSADSVYSLSTHHNKGGSRRFMLALATLEYLGYKRSAIMYPVVSEIQFWYR